MWPWEHAVVGYLAFSILVHLCYRRSPTGREAVVVGFASVLPDLIDKPLGWHYGVFDSGFGVGHSVFFAVPLAVAVFGVAAAVDRANLGAGFGLAYLIHLPADLVPIYVQYGSVPTSRILWPVQSAEGGDYEGGLVGTFTDYLAAYVNMLLTDPNGYVLAVTGMMGLAALLWLYDGLPGLREPVAYLWDQATDDRRDAGAHSR